MTAKYQDLLSKIESIWQVDLYADLDLPEVEAKQKIKRFLETIKGYSSQLKKFIDPQWIILAGGRVPGR